jgi:ATP-dependent Zn protease
MALSDTLDKIEESTKLKEKRMGNWIKSIKQNEVYFRPSDEREIYKGNFVDSAKQISDIIEKHREKRITDIFPSPNAGDASVLVTSEYEPEMGVDLPFGFYKYNKGTFTMPTRLTPLDTRKDTYVPVQSMYEELKKDIHTFLKSKFIYEKLGTHYKRGYLFYGPPGNGKTAFLRHAISEIMPSESFVILVNGGEFFSDEYIYHLKELKGLKIIIIEEIMPDKSEYKMSEILTFLDGETTPDDLIVIGTTNYPEYLQANLADRAGRFDIVKEFPEPSNSERQEILETFLNRKLEKDEVDLSKLSIAYIKEMALRHLMTGNSLASIKEEIRNHREKFKNNFEEKRSLGLGMPKASVKPD